MEPSTGELVIRVVVATLLGGVIGFEREYRGQPAGLRTHILVCVGSALFGLTGLALAADSPTVDPTRIAAQIVTGIGFLGAGAIIHQGVTIRGLTTAASLWVTAAIGTATGLGYVEGALVTGAVVLPTLIVLKHLERRLFPAAPPDDPPDT